jgi:RHS repeat-associated protein
MGDTRRRKLPVILAILAAAVGFAGPASASFAPLAPNPPTPSLTASVETPTPYNGARLSWSRTPTGPRPYFGARYYGSKIARFTTIDPFLDQKAALIDPQRWNRYAYGRNNPLRYVDPVGRDVFTQQEVFQAASEYQRGEITFQQYQAQMNAIGVSGVVGTGVLAAVAAGFAAPQLLAVAAVKAADPRTQEMVAGIAEGVSGAAPSAMGGLPIASGDRFTRAFKTGKGVVEMAAEAVVQGETLHLRDIAVFPRGAQRLQLGTQEVLAMRQQLAREARQLGFEQLRLTGTRVSGAKPGKAVDVTIDLMKRQ